MEFKDFDQVRRWQEMAVALLKKYCERYYFYKKAEFENEHLEYADLTENDPNFFEAYKLYIEASQQDIVEKIEELSELVKSGKLKQFEFKNLQAFHLSHHLYTPLLYIKSDLVEVKPVVLESESERSFVADLKKFCDGSNGFFKDKEFYLLRNMSRGKGVGFFEAANFYPDFILWLLVGDKQYISFVDPKGIRNLAGLQDDKIQFFKKVKDIEQRLNGAGIILNSFIVSSTSYQQPAWWHNQVTKSDFESNHVLFQEDKDTYINRLLQLM